MTTRSTESTVGQLLNRGRELLARGRGEATPREAALLLRHLLDIDEAKLRADPARVVDSEVARHFMTLIARRAAGEPAAYLLGEREFYGRPFRVTPAVLIPRPETELVVDLALELRLSDRPRILDLGTGSGCLAVTLASELPQALVTATDASPAVIAVARGNARRYRVASRVRLVLSDWASSLRLSEFDLVVANPPYLTEAEWQAAAAEVRDHEPRSALLGGAGGTEAYTRLAEASRGLSAGCRVLLEIGAGQAAAVGQLFRGVLENMAIHRDLAGLDRVVVGTRRA